MPDACHIEVWDLNTCMHAHNKEEIKGGTAEKQYMYEVEPVMEVSKSLQSTWPSHIEFRRLIPQSLHDAQQVLRLI